MAALTAKAWAFARPSPCQFNPSCPKGHKPLTFSLSLGRRPPPPSVARRRSRNRMDAGVPVPSNRRKKIEEEDQVEDDLDEDAFEALFKQLEEDLKNDDQPLGDSDDDDITEEDLAMLERELTEALGDAEYEEPKENTVSNSESIDDDDDDDEIRISKLKNWQLRRLSRALKIGRRKTSIKSLAAELGLDRALVLDLLRDPPPTLLLMSAALPNEAPQVMPSEPKTIPVEDAASLSEEEPQAEAEAAEHVDAKDEKQEETKLPIHVMRQRWFLKKRLKKVQVETLEKVYLRTKRPTNAMVSSIVHVTNLPKRKVIEWFEEKRSRDGVPEHRDPYRRAAIAATD